MRRYIERTPITDKKAFHYYLDRAKHRTPSNTYNEISYRAIINDFWSRVKENLIEKRGGIYVEKFGYFFVSVSPKRKIVKSRNGKESYINAHSGSYVYFPVFIPERHLWKLRTFVMDRNFSDEVKQRVSKKIKSGFKYLNFFYEINRTFKNKFVLAKFIKG